MTPDEIHEHALRFTEWHNARLQPSKPRPRRMQRKVRAHRGKEASRHLFRGEMLTVNEIVERTGVDMRTVYRRLKAGTIETALDEKKGHSFCGQKLTVAEIAERFGVGMSTIYRHIKAGTLATLEARCAHVDQQ